jgi:hypothetical protein
VGSSANVEPPRFVFSLDCRVKTVKIMNSYKIFFLVYKSYFWFLRLLRLVERLVICLRLVSRLVVVLVIRNCVLLLVYLLPFALKRKINCILVACSFLLAKMTKKSWFLVFFSCFICLEIHQENKFFPSTQDLYTFCLF